MFPLVIAICSGCASSGYMVDRGRDAADVFTITVGTGGGLKGRVGPVQVAVIENSDLVGLRCGDVFIDGNTLTHNDEMFSPYPLGSLRTTKWAVLFGQERFSLGQDDTAYDRKKDISAGSPFPCIALGRSAPYYSQVEICGGLGFTLRLGFNIGELLDFILGWSGVDIYSDDLNAP